MSFPYAVWVAAIERHHRLIVVASVVVCLLSALSLTRLHLDIDVLNMLPQGRPAFDDFKSFMADFGELNQLVVMIEGEPADRLQAFADAFAVRLAGLDTVAAVHSRIDVQQILDGVLGRYLYNYLTEKDYAELAQRLTPAGIDVQVAADRAILSAPFDLSATKAVVEDPLGVRRLAAGAFAESYTGVAPSLSGGYFGSSDGNALLVLVRPKQSAFEGGFSERLMGQVRAAEAETRAAVEAQHAAVAVGAQHAAPLRVAYTGSYVYAIEDAATLQGDVSRYTALALIGVLAVFYVGYRNLRILPFVTYPLIVTTLVTFALSLLLFKELNAVSISFAAILYGLSIDSGIYFYSRLLQERQHQSLRAAVTATLAGLGRANLVATTTTAAAFFVIGFSCLGAVRQLGFLTALGMLLTTAQFFTLYPALGFFVARPEHEGVGIFETRHLARVAEAAAKRAVPLATLAALLGVALLFAARQVTLDIHLTHLRPRHSEAARVQDEIAARFGWQESGGAVLVRRATLEEALVDSEAVGLQLLQYQSEGVLQSVQSVQAVLPSVRTQQARLALYDQLPRATAVEELRAALARHGFVAPRFADFLSQFRQPRRDIVGIDTPALAPLAFLVNHHVRVRQGESIVATYVQPAAGITLRTVAERLQHDAGNLRPILASRSLLEEELGAVLRRELARFFVLGLVGNFLLLLISFGSVGLAVAVLAPVVLVVIALFASMWATGIALDPVNLIVTALIFGIGVDYGVYIVARARERGSAPAAIRYTGRAVVVTALATITGFGFLGLSRYPALATMGLLTGLGLFLCLALSIILLPALMKLLWRNEGAQRWTQRL
ncbi:MAG TPA: MMPL family transporter [Candidatus Binatia bacterium]